MDVKGKTLSTQIQQLEKQREELLQRQQRSKKQQEELFGVFQKQRELLEDTIYAFKDTDEMLKLGVVEEEIKTLQMHTFNELQNYQEELEIKHKKLGSTVDILREEALAKQEKEDGN